MTDLEVLLFVLAKRSESLELMPIYKLPERPRLMTRLSWKIAAECHRLKIPSVVLSCDMTCS
ncbi:hypothetical protein BDR05DRAFT_957053 [Suillus weaverae]|nr:hypothetical protein BDR05DRAFT_957053 [Suillus weaverae]